MQKLNISKICRTFATALREKLRGAPFFYLIIYFLTTV